MNGAVAIDTIQTRTMFLQGSWVDLQNQLRQSLSFRVYVKLIIDPWIDHLQDNPMGRNPNTLVHILGALHSRSGVAIRQELRKLQSSSDVQVNELVFEIYIMFAISTIFKTFRI